MHPIESMKKVKKYMNGLKVGQLMPNDVNTDCYKEDFKVSDFIHEYFNHWLFYYFKQEIIKDFKELKLLTEKMNLYESDISFFAFMFLHICLLEIISISLLHYSGHSNWFTCLIALLCQTFAYVKIILAILNEC
jgi:hypothetical protein